MRSYPGSVWFNGGRTRTATFTAVLASSSEARLPPAPPPPALLLMLNLLLLRGVDRIMALMGLEGRLHGGEAGGEVAISREKKESMDGLCLLGGGGDVGGWLSSQGAWLSQGLDGTSAAQKEAQFRAIRRM